MGERKRAGGKRHFAKAKLPPLPGRAYQATDHHYDERDDDHDDYYYDDHDDD